MSKVKYRFNADSLSYEKVEHNIRKMILRAIPHFLSSIILALILYFVVFNYLFESPKEKRLIREISQLMTQYKFLNDEMEKAKQVLGDIQYRDDNIYRTIFEAEPVSNEIREAGFGGYNRYEYLEGYDYSDIVIETTKKLDILLTQLYIQSKSYDEVMELAKNKEQYLSCVPAIQPIRGVDLTHIASYYGYRNDPVYRGTKEFHEGIDFTAAHGTNIFATGDGIVSEADFSNSGYGNQVIINHGFGYKTRYAHLKKILVQPGQKIKRGEIIGKVGSTGKSVGPHLHYEVLKNGKSVDPINYFYLDLTPEQYNRMIELAALEGGQSLD
ncbi:MAG: M23 family metallopeptidase [Bacteroidia bacterium]|nr:M23 family metallopeptidase [Bacteroidia bacterium]